MAAAAGRWARIQLILISPHTAAAAAAAAEKGTRRSLTSKSETRRHQKGEEIALDRVREERRREEKTVRVALGRLLTRKRIHKVAMHTYV